MFDLLKVRRGIVTRLLRQWRPIFDQLSEKIHQVHNEWQAKKMVYEVISQVYAGATPPVGSEAHYELLLKQKEMTMAKSLYKQLVTLKDDLNNYVRRVPVLGYNSARYDLNLIRSWLMDTLLTTKENNTVPTFWVPGKSAVGSLYPQNEDWQQLEGVSYPEFDPEPAVFDLACVKQMSAYTSLQIGDKLWFRDVMKFQAPGVGLAGFLNTFNKQEAGLLKGKFPYEYLTLKTLDSTQIPPPSAFWSELNQANSLGSTESEIQATWETEVRDIWLREGCTSVRDYLRWYNIQDVGPFVRAIQSWLKGYHLDPAIDPVAARMDGLDVLKLCFGAAGIAERLMRRYAAAHPGFRGWCLFDEDHRHIDEKISDNIVGGPSIIFSTKAEAGVTRIRDQEKGKFCQSILGLDASALYASRLQQPLPHGIPVEWVRQEKSQDSDLDSDLEEDGEQQKYGLLMEDVFNRKLVAGKDAGKKKKKMKGTTHSFLEMETIHSICTGAHPFLPHLPHLQHFFNTGQEQRVGGLSVDGICHVTKQILEIYGCHWHGCSSCTEFKIKKGITPQKANELKFRYQATQSRKKFLERHMPGYKVIEFWECMLNPYSVRKTQEKFPRMCMPHADKGIRSSHLLDLIMEEKFNGLVEVDMHVPPELYEKFAESSPFYITSEVEEHMMTPEMREYLKVKGLSMSKPRVMLVGAMAVERYVITADLLRWYLSHHLKVTRVRWALEFEETKLLDGFIRGLVSKRRAATQRNDKPEADKNKLIGNSAFGVTMKDKQKYSNTCYVIADDITSHHKRRTFKHSRAVTENVLEVQHSKQSIRMDIPRYLGLYILCSAKKHMLDFYFSCMDKFCDRSDWFLSSMDTDSQYAPLSCSIEGSKINRKSDKFDLDYHPLLPIVRPDQKEEFLSRIKDHCDQGAGQFKHQLGHHWLPRQCCLACFDYDDKVPGLLKIEAHGIKQVSVSSKCQALTEQDGQKEKITTKGVQKNRALQPLLQKIGKTFTQVLEEAQDGTYPALRAAAATPSDSAVLSPVPEAPNRGFRIDPATQTERSQVLTYEQMKPVANMFYTKRRIDANGITTSPITQVLIPAKVLQRDRQFAKAEARVAKRRAKELQEQKEGSSQKKIRLGQEEDDCSMDSIDSCFSQDSQWDHNDQQLVEADEVMMDLGEEEEGSYDP